MKSLHSLILHSVSHIHTGKLFLCSRVGTSTNCAPRAVDLLVLARTRAASARRVHDSAPALISYHARAAIDRLASAACTGAGAARSTQ
eukprot:COSAG02_NODE_1006_length_15265_cov_58.666886_7_plen_88_part_00